MKPSLILRIAACFGAILFLSACSQRQAYMTKAASVDEAIESSQVIPSVSEKTNYLLSQARLFYQSKDYEGALVLSGYILEKIDKDSLQARRIFEKAQQELLKSAHKKLNEAMRELQRLR